MHKIAPIDLKPGIVVELHPGVPSYTVETAPKIIKGEVMVYVQWADGGRDQRWWDEKFVYERVVPVMD